MEKLFRCNSRVQQVVLKDQQSQSFHSSKDCLCILLVTCQERARDHIQ